jgi:hypothetical protein
MTKLINRLRSGPEDAFDAVDIMNDAADHIERLEKIIRSAVNMRAQQRAYFKNKTKNALVEAKKAESSFDKIAMEYVTGGNNGHR